MERGSGRSARCEEGKRESTVSPDGGEAETGKQRGMVGRRACGQGCITGADYWSMVVHCMEETATVCMMGRLLMSSVIMTRNKVRPA